MLWRVGILCASNMTCLSNNQLYLAKKFCTPGFSGKFCLNPAWLYIMLYRCLHKGQQLDEFPTEIQGSLLKLTLLKASRGHSSKVAEWPIMAFRAENMEYLNTI